MKKIIIIAFGLIIVIAGIIATVILLNKKETEPKELYQEIKEISSLDFSYDKGYAVNANISYRIRKEDDKYIATIKLYGVPEEEAKKVVISDEKINEIENILNKYKVIKWDGFKKSDSGVLDGDSFSFSLNYEDEKSIYAHGYMKWPENYREVRDELDKVFEGLIAE